MQKVSSYCVPCSITRFTSTWSYRGWTTDSSSGGGSCGSHCIPEERKDCGKMLHPTLFLPSDQRRLFGFSLWSINRRSHQELETFRRLSRTARKDLHVFFISNLGFVSTRIAYFFAKKWYWSCLFLPHFCQKSQDLLLISQKRQKRQKLSTGVA